MITPGNDRSKVLPAPNATSGVLSFIPDCAWPRPTPKSTISCISHLFHRFCRICIPRKDTSPGMPPASCSPLVVSQELSKCMDNDISEFRLFFSMRIVFTDFLLTRKSGHVKRANSGQRSIPRFSDHVVSIRIPTYQNK
jgi:hypothetical protein